MIKSFLILLSIFLISYSYSQVVSIEHQRILCDTNGFFGGVHLESEATQDKLSKFEMSTGINLSYKHNRHLFLNLTTYDVGKIEGTNYTNRFFNHTRYNFDLHKEIYVAEAFFQIMANDFLDVDNRTLVGAGLRIRLLNKDKATLHFGFLSMCEYERLSDNEINESFRSSDYLSFVLRINKRLNLLSAIYYQPKYDNFKDYRIYFSNAFEIQITKHIYFAIVANILYDEYPAPGIKNTVYSTTNRLTFKF